MANDSLDTNMLFSDDAISEKLQNLAGCVNFTFNTNNHKEAVRYMNELFDECYGRNGYKLLLISDDATQVVGLAFTSIARYLNFNDRDLNSVAAENALYCLARNFIATGNTYCVPAIFTLLINYSDLLRDKLIAAHCAITQKNMRFPIGLALGGNPFSAPHLNDFRKQAVLKRVSIMAYILPCFYTEKSKEYSIPTDMPYHIPSQSDINNFLMLKSQKMDTEYGDVEELTLIEGKRYFYQLFEECQETLLKTQSW